MFQVLRFGSTESRPTKDATESRRNYRFGDGETEGAVLAAGDAAGTGVAALTELETDGAGLDVAEATAAGELFGLVAGVAEPVGEPATEAPGIGVAEATGAGVCPALNSLVRLLGAFALRA